MTYSQAGFDNNISELKFQITTELEQGHANVLKRWPQSAPINRLNDRTKTVSGKLYSILAAELRNFAVIRALLNYLRIIRNSLEMEERRQVCSVNAQKTITALKH